MAEAEVFVGVDVSKERLDVALWPQQEFFNVTNDARGVKRLVKRLQSLNCSKIVLEATGGYQTLAAAALYAAQLPLAVVNPRLARAFAQGLGRLAKNDRIDALMLARYATEPEVKVRPLPDAETQQLRALCARREELLEMLGAEEQRLEHAPALLRREINTHINFLRKRLKRTDRDLDQALKSSAVWREKGELLRSVPGVGRVVCANLLARLPELGQLNRGEAAALVGVAPRTNQSGKFRGKEFISGGRGALRRVLYMAALCGIVRNPVLRAQYQRLRKDGKPAKVALVAAMRKLVITLNAILKTGSHWNPSCAPTA